MRLQNSPNAWSCLPTAFAMAVGCPVEDLIHRLGHDGSEIAWPELPEPMRRRGFHVQEIIVALLPQFSVTPVELVARIAPNLEVPPRLIDNTAAFQQVVKTTRGVLTGYTKCGHAVAYDHGRILDPRGLLAPKDFTPICAWIIE